MVLYDMPRYFMTCPKMSSVATGSGHLDYPGHLGHFLSRSKWVSAGHTNMPDPDQNCLVIMLIKNCNKKIDTL